jgi:hypothetical protein
LVLLFRCNTLLLTLDHLTLGMGRFLVDKASIKNVNIVKILSRLY